MRAPLQENRWWRVRSVDSAGRELMRVDVLASSRTRARWNAAESHGFTPWYWEGVSFKAHPLDFPVAP